jgi:hypothetical protein
MWKPIGLIACLFSVVSVTFADVPEPQSLFEENFEAPGAIDRWDTISTADGRIRIVADPSDPSNDVLSMDDSSNDELFSFNSSIDIKLEGVASRRILPEPPTSVSESDAELSFPVVISPAPDADLSIQLRRGAVVLGSATFPAGSTLATLSFPGLDDAVLDGTETMQLHLSDGYFNSAPFSLMVIDNESAGLVLEIPATMAEDATGVTGRVTITEPMSRSLYVSLSSGDVGRLHVPASIYISSHSGTATFPLSPVPDPTITGDQSVTVTARFGVETVSQATVVVESNSLDPFVSGLVPFVEGSTDQPITVGVNAEVDAPLVVELAADDPAVSFDPSTVTLVAGQSSGTVLLSVADDSETQGNREFVIVATVVGRPQAMVKGVIVDNDVSALAWTLPRRWRDGSPEYGDRA